MLTALALRQGFLVQQIACLWIQRCVHRNEVAAAPDFLQLHTLQTRLPEPLRRHNRVVAQHHHPQLLRALRHLLADAPAADDANGLAVHLDAGEGLAIPPSLRG